MEVIQQRISNVNGVPAHKAGEWPGIVSAKWTGSRRILKPLEKMKKNGFEVMIGGRRHFNIARSVEMNFRPRMRIFEKKDADEANLIKPGLRRIEPRYTEPKVYERKTLGHVITIKDNLTQCTKQFPEKIIRCKDEFEVENVIGRKKRLPNLEFIRNGLPIISPGDKIYKNVDYSPDFFKLEGLVVGSTNKENHNKTSAKKGDNFYDSLDLSVKILDKNKLWKHKCLRESLEVDNKYVHDLEIWEDAYLKPLLSEDNRNIHTNKKPTITIKKK